MRWRDFPLGAFPPTDTVSTGDEPHRCRFLPSFFFHFIFSFLVLFAPGGAGSVGSVDREIGPITSS